MGTAGISEAISEAACPTRACGERPGRERPGSDVSDPSAGDIGLHALRRVRPRVCRRAPHPANQRQGAEQARDRHRRGPWSSQRDRGGRDREREDVELSDFGGDRRRRRAEDRLGIGTDWARCGKDRAASAEGKAAARARGGRRPGAVRAPAVLVPRSRGSAAWPRFELPDFTRGARRLPRLERTSPAGPPRCGSQRGRCYASRLSLSCLTS